MEAENNNLKNKGEDIGDVQKHYNESRNNYLKAMGEMVDAGIGGESHLEYYRDKYPENYSRLIKEERPFLNEGINSHNERITEFKFENSTYESKSAVESIPDANFRKALLDKNPELKEDFSNLSKVARNAETLVLRDADINDLKGIELFKNIKYLDVSNNNIESLDLSNNRKLEWLYAENNKIVDVNLIENDKLAGLHLTNNNIKELDLENNKALLEVWVAGNKIEKLDISNNDKIIDIKNDYGVFNSWGLNQEPVVSLSKESDSKVSFENGRDLQKEEAAVKELEKQESKIVDGKVEISGNIEDIIPDKNFREGLLENRNDLKEDFSNISEVAYKADALNLQSKGIEDLKGIEIFENIKYLNVDDNELIKLDVSENTKLEWLYAESNNLTKIDLSLNDELLGIHLSNNNLNELDLEHNVALREVWVENNALIGGLDLSNNDDLIDVRNDVGVFDSMSLDFGEVEYGAKIDVYSEEIIGGGQPVFIADEELINHIEVVYDVEFNDGFISKIDANLVTELNLRGEYIKTLSGIEGLENLEKLDVRGTQVKEIDFSTSPNLKLNNVQFDDGVIMKGGVDPYPDTELNKGNKETQGKQLVENTPIENFIHNRSDNSEYIVTKSVVSNILSDDKIESLKAMDNDSFRGEIGRIINEYKSQVEDVKNQKIDKIGELVEKGTDEKWIAAVGGELYVESKLRDVFGKDSELIDYIPKNAKQVVVAEGFDFDSPKVKEAFSEVPGGTQKLEYIKENFQNKEINIEKDTGLNNEKDNEKSKGFRF